MYFRCVDCGGATWVQDTPAATGSRPLTCRGCQRSYTVRPSPILQADPRSQYETAVALAEGNGLDLPTSYSVMLGIMTLEHATAVRDQGKTAPDAAKRRTAKPSSGRLVALTYDPAFEDAVRQGYMSVQQAVERGNRAEYAKRLIDRHGLTQPLAYLVADNRTSLSSALQKDREEVEEILRPVKRAIWKNAVAAVLGGLAVVGVAIYGMYVWSTIERENERVGAWAETVAEKHDRARGATPDSPAIAPGDIPARRVRVLKDDFGRVTEIEGPDPSSVLLAYCSHGFGAGRFRAVELTQAVPPRPGSQLGIFEDSADPGKRFAIPIRRQLRGSRWTAGDGVHPIDPIEAPELPHDARRIPVLVRDRGESDS
ncbi:MAG TPA: hypothetical protein VD788_15330 [Candidatus Polarisedimenticolaceae bacterium]|nr:hypothetical protein [Candidatus Polarisedimenticolaceae bacterium]